MFGTLKDAIKKILPSQPDGPAGQEVALSAFALTETDAKLCKGLSVGDELAVLCDVSGEFTVARRGRTVGGVPEAERPQMARLLHQGTRLNCRVVKLGGDGLVRVRVSIVL